MRKRERNPRRRRPIAFISWGSRSLVSKLAASLFTLGVVKYPRRRNRGTSIDHRGQANVATGGPVKALRILPGSRGEGGLSLVWFRASSLPFQVDCLSTWGWCPLTRRREQTAAQLRKIRAMGTVRWAHLLPQRSGESGWGSSPWRVSLILRTPLHTLPEPTEWGESCGLYNVAWAPSPLETPPRLPEGSRQLPVIRSRRITSLCAICRYLLPFCAWRRVTRPGCHQSAFAVNG